MDAIEVMELIKQKLPDAEIEVEGQDCDFNVTVISDSFKDMSLVERQKLVLSGFTEQLASGALHALSVKALTPEQWSAKQTASLTQITM